MTDSTSFYGAAAGTIPLLYIALAVEERAGTLLEDLVCVFAADGSARPVIAAILRGVYLCVVTVVLISGVGAAFVGLAHPKAGLHFAVGYTAWFVAAALGFGGLLLVFQPFVSAVVSVLKHKDISRSASVITLAIAVGAALFSVYVVWAIVWALLH